MGSGERNGALSCPTGGKDMGGVGGVGEGVSEKTCLHRERRKTARRRIIIHNHSGFPTLLQPSIALKRST